jgi:tetratricopeptide (TPR) repeat protein
MMLLFAVAKRASAPLRRLALFACPLLLTSCITLTPRSTRPSSSATVIPNMPMLRWGVESCGAGSLASVLQHYGDPTTMLQWDAALPKTRGGVMTIDLLLAARQKAFDAQLVTGTPQIVAEELRAGHPVILMLQVVDYPGKHFDFFHYIVADGLDSDRRLIRTQWGDGRARWVSFATIESPWSGGGHAAIVIRPADIKDALRAAIALEEDGKVAEAAERYRQILASHPDSAVAWTDLGNAEVKLQQLDGAEQSFRKALALDPNSRDALNNLAWLLYERKRLDEAESLARRAAAQPGPDGYLILDTLARVLAANGRCSEALQTFQQAIDAVPSSRVQARTDIEAGLAAARRTCPTSS